MRRFAVVAAGAALVAMAASPSALGSSPFDRHFVVNSKTTSVHEADDGTVTFKDILRPTWSRTERVGRDVGRCEPSGHHKYRCRVFTHLDGTVGGYGDMIAKGNLGGRHDNTLLVVNGNGDFDGVAGKLIIHNNSEVHFDLTR